MKKIVMIGSAHPLRGGIASSGEAISRALQSKGHQLSIYTFSLQYPAILFPGKTQFSPDPAPKDLDIKVKINSVNPLNWLKIGRELKALKPDVIVCRYWIPFLGPCLGAILRIAKQNKHTKIVVLADNMIPHEKRPGDKLFTKYFVGPVDAFMVMSRQVEKDVRIFSDKPVLYSPHPTFDNYGAVAERGESIDYLKLDPNRKYILFSGFIRKYKGLDILLKAMADERVKELNLCLLVAGEFYDKREEYEAIIKEHGLEDNLVIRDEFIPSAEMRYYFAASDLLTLPYRTATQSGVAQLAYLFDTPMLVTNVGGLPEIVDHGETGYTVAPENPGAVADALLDFYTQNRQDSMLKAVIKNKKRFSLDTMVEKFEELFEQL